MTTVIPVPQSNSEQYSKIFVRCFVLSLVILFAVVHSPMSFLRHWFDAVLNFLPHYLSTDVVNSIKLQKDLILQQYVVPFRGLIFISSLLCIILPILQVMRVFFKDHSFLENRTILKQAAYAFLFLSLLTFPFKLGLMAEGYAQVSMNPFGVIDESNLLYQRLLMPVFAFILQLQGPLLYHVFSLIITFLLLVLIVLFFRIRGISLSILEIVSISTCSFVITQFQSPGYTEPLAYIAMLLVFIVPTGTFARLGLVVLAMLAHEISILPFLLIAFLYFSKEEFMMVCSIAFFYGIFWILSFGLNPQSAVGVREVAGMSAFDWIILNPLYEILGILISMKTFWIVILIAAYQMRNYRSIILGSIAIALVFTLLGVDTSRLMGYSILSLLFSYYAVKKYELIPAQTLHYLTIFNIILPSVYVGTNYGIVFFNGFYQLLYQGILFR